MSTPYVGEIRLFAGNFAPVGWALCDGSLLSTSQYQALFSLLGTTYGGDGQSNFALPDLRGRVPIHPGSGAGGTYVLGGVGGTETVTLTPPQLPPHTHAAAGTAADATLDAPGGAVWAAGAQIKQFAPAVGTPLPMASAAVAPAGDSQPHSNMAPFTAINFIISLLGVFPTP